MRDGHMRGTDHDNTDGIGAELRERLRTSMRVEMKPCIVACLLHLVAEHVIGSVGLGGGRGS